MMKATKIVALAALCGTFALGMGCAIHPNLNVNADLAKVTEGPEDGSRVSVILEGQDEAIEGEIVSSSFNWIAIETDDGSETWIPIGRVKSIQVSE